jgi:type IV secretory pathway TrbL component
MTQNIKANILRALNACDGLPMPEAALLAAVENLSQPARLTQSDIKNAVRSLEAEDFIAGVNDSIIGTSWMLTLRGIFKARQV